jgi:DNA mismatch repair protein MutS
MAPGAVSFPGPPSTDGEEVDPTPFHSILFPGAGGRTPTSVPAEPPYFGDLHLDDIERSILADAGSRELAWVFRVPLTDVAAITYRQDVFRDLEDEAALAALRDFGESMQAVRRRLGHAQKSHHDFDRERWLLSAVDAYQEAVMTLGRGLAPADLRSAGLRGFRDHLAAYVRSQAFTAPVEDTRRTRASIAGVSYRMRIHGPRVTVTRAREEPDYSAEVLQAFEKFRQGTAKPYGWRFDTGSDMNHVEAAILDRVARLHPGAFETLHGYASRNAKFLDPVIDRFDREIRWYLAVHDHVERVEGELGLPFCYPRVDETGPGMLGSGMFDLALAGSLLGSRTPVIPNDIALRGDERVVLVSGPNQGGKTTFARAIGQLHHLARLGMPVPGESARVSLVDQIFTHFERAEQVEDLSSKLEDDLRRIRAILEQATASSLVIMNESFSSTTVEDQRFIGAQVMRRILDCGLRCVVVTFLDELVALDTAIVSMVSTVEPGDDAPRTFRIVRRPPDGLAYAMAIAEKHGLTYPSVKARLSG